MSEISILLLSVLNVSRVYYHRLCTVFDDWIVKYTEKRYICTKQSDCVPKNYLRNEKTTLSIRNLYIDYHKLRSSGDPKQQWQ